MFLWLTCVPVISLEPNFFFGSNSTLR
jgi:hypothetical protein